MVAVSLLRFLHDRKRETALVAALATLLVALALLAFVALLGVAMADSSVADVRGIDPFRWGHIDAGEV